MKLLYADVQCVYIMYAKYQLLTVKALVQVEFSFHALFEHPYEDANNQRTNGPVNAHLISWPSKYKKYKTWKTYGKEMTLTFNTHIPS